MTSRIDKQWLLPVFIVLAVLLLFFIARRTGLPIKAQAQQQNDIESEILVIPIQMGRDSYGLAMVDTASQTIWIYELNNRGPAHSRLKLWASRSWRYDRFLRQYNTAEPKPEQVKILLENLGRQQKGMNKEGRQSLDVNMGIRESDKPDSEDSE